MSESLSEMIAPFFLRPFLWPFATLASKVVMTALALSLLLATTGCNFRGIKAGAEDGIVGETSAVGYAQVQERILGPRCVRCHGLQGGVNLENFSNVTKAAGRINARAVVEKTMPPGEPLTDGEAKMLGGWLARGAPELATAAPEHRALDLEASPNWALVRDRVFGPHCAACHSTPAPEAGLDLFALTDVRVNAGRILTRVLVDQDMPLAPFAPVDLVDKKALADWVVLGMPE